MPTTPPGYTGGSVMDYTPPAYGPSPVASINSPNWGAMIGGGLSSLGKGIGAGTTTPSSPDSPQLGGPQDYGTPRQPVAAIPQNNLLEALMRLISGT